MQVDKLSPAVILCAGVLTLACLAGCGGSSGTSSSSSSSSSGSQGSGGSGGISNGYLFGERSGTDVYMQPAPPSYTFPSWSGSAPNIRIDQVTQFSSTVNPQGSNIFQTTTQVVYGQATGPAAGKQVVVYSYTNQYYIQPLTSTTINISSDSTWIAPANAGQITALLVLQGYSAPATTTTLPAVDGVNVFALATPSVNSSQFAFSEFAIPTADSGPFGIVTGPDSALWFTENYADKIGRVSTSGMIGEYAVPTAGAAPNGIATGPEGPSGSPRAKGIKLAGSPRPASSPSTPFQHWVPLQKASSPDRMERFGLLSIRPIKLDESQLRARLPSIKCQHQALGPGVSWPVRTERCGSPRYKATRSGRSRLPDNSRNTPFPTRLVSFQPRAKLSTERMVPSGSPDLLQVSVQSPPRES